MTKLKITELSEESVISCPHCAVLHTRGVVFVEVEHEGQTFVYAELMTCCGEAMPVPVLFDSHEPAQEVLDRIAERLREPKSFFQLPLVSKQLIFGI